MTCENCDKCVCLTCPTRLIGYCILEDDLPCESCKKFGYTIRCDALEDFKKKQEVSSHERARNK